MVNSRPSHCIDRGLGSPGAPATGRAPARRRQLLVQRMPVVLAAKGVAQILGVAVENILRSGVGSKDVSPGDRAAGCRIILVAGKHVGVQVRHPVAERQEIHLDRLEHLLNGTTNLDHVAPIPCCSIRP